MSDGLAVQLGAPLLARLQSYYHANPGRTYTSIALDAVEQAYSDGSLATLFATGPLRTGPVFVGRAAKVVRHDDVRTQITLRPGQEDRATLDRLTEESTAPNRSALIAAALDRYLPGGTGG